MRVALLAALLLMPGPAPATHTHSLSRSLYAPHKLHAFVAFASKKSAHSLAATPLKSRAVMSSQKALYLWETHLCNAKTER